MVGLNSMNVNLPSKTYIAKRKRTVAMFLPCYVRTYNTVANF